MSEIKKVYFDSSRCLSCHSCEFACAVEHTTGKSAVEALRNGERPRSRRKVSLADDSPLTVACRHCEPAQCVEACMAGALQRDPETGRIVCDDDHCVGCWMCVMVCPFGAVAPGEGVSVRCDLCADREGTPACVEACPTHALFEATAEEFAEIVRRRREQAEEVPA